MKNPRADKELGQHFLKDRKVIDAICKDVPPLASAVIEVGPGPASLTKDLSALAQPLFVIEKDERFREILEDILPTEKIFFADALGFDLTSFINDKNLGENVSLVSNLPYNISTPLLVKFLQVKSIRFMTLMFQKEVAEKVFSNRANGMGSLMALTQNYFDCDILCKVPPGAFLPPPQVDSAVLSFRRKESTLVPLSEFKTYEEFLRKLFSHKRKQMGGILKQHFEPNLIEKTFEEMKLSRMLRAETLQLAEVQLLYKKLCHEKL